MVGDRVAKAKYADLCATLIDDELLTSLNVGAVELAAITYSQWLTFEKLWKKQVKEKHDGAHKTRRLATQAKNDLFRMLKDLGLVAPSKTSTAGKRKSVTARSVTPADRPARPKLNIVRLPDDARGTG